MTTKWMEQPCQQQQGAGGIINQRAEIRTAIGPGSANYARLKSLDLQNGSMVAAQVKVICDKNVNDWTDAETTYVAAQFIVAVHC
jgi:hypothetical protein